MANHRIILADRQDHGVTLTGDDDDNVIQGRILTLTKAGRQMVFHLAPVDAMALATFLQHRDITGTPSTAETAPE